MKSKTENIGERRRSMMNILKSFRLVALALAAGLVLIPAMTSFRSMASEETEKAGETAKDEKAAPPASEKLAAEPKAAEPEWIQGTIQKIDAAAKTITIQVVQRRAYRKYKLTLDDKSIILIGGQPAGLDALTEGKAVEAGFVKKGKVEVLDTLKAD
jgi:Cu/Ag efflux protein CusF